MSDLKQENCPFCGSENISAGEVSTDYAGGHGAQCTQSRCDDCGALGPEADLADGEIDYGDVKAITAWNRRTQPEATAPAQDLSAAILGIRFNADYSDPKLQAAFDRGCDEALVAAAALASSANALSAGYRVDAEKWRYIVKDGKALDGKFTLVMCQPDGSVKELHGTEYDAAISAAILQSQKGGSHA